MSEQSIPANGTFCWNELSTTDDATAMKFYGELLGWEFKSSNMSPCEGAAADAPPMVYSEIVVDGKHLGGVFKMGPEFGEMPSHWMAYVAVEDVDAKAKQVEELGGSVRVPPTDIPNTGRFCVITDPTGAVISLITLKGAHS
jgi:uncharacterized protein